MNSVAAARSHAGDAFLMLLDIIGSNASRQTTREISYRLVAALALFVTAYSWNAQPLLIARDANPSRTRFTIKCYPRYRDAHRMYRGSN